MKFKGIVIVAAGLAVAFSTPAGALKSKRLKDKDAEKVEAPAVATITIPPPPEGKGQIVWYRPGGMGFALGCSVNENGAKVSSLGAGKYFIMATDPGTHEFSVKTEAKDTLKLLVEDGETQFAMCKIKMGILVGRPDIAPSTENDFNKQKKLKMVDADDMGPAPGALRPAEVAEKLGVPVESLGAKVEDEKDASGDK